MFSLASEQNCCQVPIGTRTIHPLQRVTNRCAQTASSTGRLRARLCPDIRQLPLARMVMDSTALHYSVAVPAAFPPLGPMMCVLPEVIVCHCDGLPWVGVNSGIADGIEWLAHRFTRRGEKRIALHWTIGWCGGSAVRCLSRLDDFFLHLRPHCSLMVVRDISECRFYNFNDISFIKKLQRACGDILCFTDHSLLTHRPHF